MLGKPREAKPSSGNTKMLAKALMACCRFQTQSLSPTRVLTRKESFSSEIRAREVEQSQRMEKDSSCT